MKIWIVTTNCACDWFSGEEIAGYYTTEDKANDALEKMDNKEFYWVSEVEVE